jgi:hypothetical protein
MAKNVARLIHKELPEIALKTAPPLDFPFSKICGYLLLEIEKRATI